MSDERSYNRQPESRDQDRDRQQGSRSVSPSSRRARFAEEDAATTRHDSAPYNARGRNPDASTRFGYSQVEGRRLEGTTFNGLGANNSRGGQARLAGRTTRDGNGGSRTQNEPAIPVDLVDDSDKKTYLSSLCFF